MGRKTRKATVRMRQCALCDTFKHDVCTRMVEGPADRVAVDMCGECARLLGLSHGAHVLSRSRAVR